MAGVGWGGLSYSSRPQRNSYEQLKTKPGCAPTYLSNLVIFVNRHEMFLCHVVLAGGSPLVFLIPSA